MGHRRDDLEMSYAKFRFQRSPLPDSSGWALKLEVVASACGHTKIHEYCTHHHPTQVLTLRQKSLEIVFEPTPLRNISMRPAMGDQLNLRFYY